jgi:nucleotide-binding universal stress UspA family protein
MLRRIMVATDGSDVSLHAAEAAVNLAKIAGAGVTAIYVLDMPRLNQLHGYTSFPGLKDKLLELMRKEGEKATAEIEQMALDAGVDYDKILAEGNPAEEIIRLSLERGMDLLIMGSIGRSGLAKMLLGSVAEKVVRQSLVPVLLVPDR